MPIMKEDEVTDYTGKKLYFRKSLEDIRNRLENTSLIALSFPVFLEKGFQMNLMILNNNDSGEMLNNRM